MSKVIINSTLLWFDPGAPSGYAAVNTRDWNFESGELNMLELGDWLRVRLRKTHVSAMGWEDWVIRPGTSRMTRDTSAPETIGMLRWLAHYYNIPVLVQQPSSHILGILHLSTIGWHNSGKDDANKAAGHMLTYLLHANLLPAHLLGKILGKMDVDDISN